MGADVLLLLGSVSSGVPPRFIRSTTPTMVKVSMNYTSLPSPQPSPPTSPAPAGTGRLPKRAFMTTQAWPLATATVVAPSKESDVNSPRTDSVVVVAVGRRRKENVKDTVFIHSVLAHAEMDRKKPSASVYNNSNPSPAGTSVTGS